MLNKCKLATATTLYCTLLLLIVAQASATEIIYAPINPTFGGNPNNAPGLMSAAQAQNLFTAEVQTPIETFNATLQRSILSRLASQSLNAIFGSGNKLTVGTYDTEVYTVQVIQNGLNSLTIITTDKITGETSSFVVTNGTI
jgi:curli production assembly/transport component CsgF